MDADRVRVLKRGAEGVVLARQRANQRATRIGASCGDEGVRGGRCGQLATCEGVCGRTEMVAEVVGL